MGRVHDGSPSSLAFISDGPSTQREIITDGGRRFRLRFIAARLHDNPYLTNTGYREQLL
jgi:hypothetical protein